MRSGGPATAPRRPGSANEAADRPPTEPSTTSDTARDPGVSAAPELTGELALELTDPTALRSLTGGGTPDGDDAADTGRSARLVSAGLVMAAGTAVSRILGFGRAVMIAIVIGVTTRQGDMFTIANTVPNSIYILLAGGVLNTVFVPQLVRAIKHDEDRGEAYTNRILTAILLILLGITVIVTVLTPVILWLYSSGQWHTAELAPQFHSMVLIGYLCMPQLFFYGAFTLVGQVLNARGVFGPMMWAPLANNVVSIAVLVVYLAVWGMAGDGTAAFTTSQALLLGLGSSLGIAVQAAVLIPFMRRAGFRYRPRFDLRRAGLGHTFRLAQWTLGFVLVTQLGLIVLTRLASDATVNGSGAGWLAYNNAYLLWILPHSLVTISLVTAMLPHASALAADNDLEGVRDEAARTMRLATAVVLPVAAAFLALCFPISAVVLGWGKTSGATGPLAWTLAAFSLGLVPFTLQYVCQRTFYAMEDTKTPFLQQCVIVAVNVLVGLSLVLPFRAPDWIAPALALAYSAAYSVGVVISYRSLGYRLPGLTRTGLARHLVRLTIAVAPAAVAAWALCFAAERLLPGQLGHIVGLLAAGVVAVPMFMIMARVLLIAEVGQIMAPLLRRARLQRLASALSVPGAAAGSIRGTDRSVPGAAGGQTPPDSPSLGPDRDANSSEAGMMLTQTTTGSVSRPGVEPDESYDDETTITESGASDADPSHGDASNTDASNTDDGDTTARLGAVDDRVHPGADLTDEQPHPVLTTGRILGSRYRLEEVMAQRRGIATWRATDQVLSRSVLCHVLLPGDPRIDQVMEAARASAIATDSRFLRVLDAVQVRPVQETLPVDGDAEDEDPDADIGCYVVAEFAPGQTLLTLLGQGPLSALEAAWVVHEVADALAGVHSAGLYHQRISPDTVVITASGNVKIVGLLLEAALGARPHGAETGAPSHRGRITDAEGEDPEERAAADDVADLGRLLYACLVQRWPGGDRWGLPAAPEDGHGGWLSPRQVRAGVPPALDRICTLTLRPSAADPIRTAHGVVNALSRVLGTADASSDLESRLRQPVPIVGAEPLVASPVSAYWAQRDAVESPPPRTPLRARTAASRTTPVPVDEPDPAQERPPRRRWVIALVLIVVIALLAAIAVAVATAVLTTGDHVSTSPSGSVSTTPVAVKTLPIVGGRDFDPKGDGGSGAENPKTVRLAYDGNPDTVWHTETYRDSADLNGGKPGAGIILDLGTAHTVTSLTLVMDGKGSTLQIRVPADDPTTITKPPMTSQTQWKAQAALKNASGTQTVTLAEPVTTRYVLIYFTKLAPLGNNWRSGIAEVTVTGH